MILVAEDSEESLHVLVSILDENGFDVRPTITGTLALNAARSLQPDLILLDIGLPDLDGYQVCMQLKADERTRDIPIIFISGLHATSDKVKAFSAGGVDYITKPFQAEEIKARIMTHLALRQMRTQLQEQNDALRREIEARQEAQQELHQAHAELEKKVLERTSELAETNSILRAEIDERERSQAELRRALDVIVQLKARLQRENIYLRETIDEERGNKTILGNSRPIRAVLDQIGQVSGTASTVLILGETGTGKELVAQTIHDRSPRKLRAMVRVNCAALPSGIVESELFGRTKGAYTGATTDQAGRFEVADGSTIFLDEVGELAPELQAKLLRVLEDGTLERLGSAKTISVDVRVIAATNKDLEKAVQEGKFRADLYYRLNVFPIRVPPLRERIEDIPVLSQDLIRQSARKMGVPARDLDAEAMIELCNYSWPGNVRELRNLIERAMITSPGDRLVIQLPESHFPGARESLELEEMERQHIIKVLEGTRWRVKGKDGAAEVLGLKPTTLQSRMKKLGIDRPLS